MANAIQQATVVTDHTVPSSRTGLGKVAFFDADGNPWNGSDAVLDTITVTGAIGTAAKTTTQSEPKAGTLVPIKFTSGNSANAVTVAFNGGAARAVYASGAASTGAKLALAANGVALFFFDGTILHQVGIYE